MDAAHTALVAGAALAAGAVNAIAGGGSLLTFPALVAAGLPEITASVTNTVALCPGYLGATWAQRRELRDQRRRIALFAPAGVIGGLAGGLLLLHTGEAAFARVVPFLILFAALLLAAQDRLRALIGRAHRREMWAVVPVLLACVYGGYFGAGLGVIILGALAIVVDDSMTRLNALKQAISLACNIAAATFFLFSGRIDWTVTAIMAGASLAGGVLGGALASRIPARVLRVVVISFAIVVGVFYLVR
ncbi:MAG: sulfite exporter TauE/SafE family protein [Deltaproteobacteria bacterium]|nr:sulfite exporter TauE/SafE family protein [Deltaproteobacteria bacterium]